MDYLLKLDTHFFVWLNGFHSPLWDSIMVFISGKIEWIPLYVILLAFIIRKYRVKSIWIIITIVLLITLADTISTKLLKDTVQRLRPSHEPGLSNVIHLVNNHHGGLYGFVSSHAANTFALAFFLSFLFKQKWFTYSILLWALVVSYSRIYLGLHYPGDILGGALLGAVLAILLNKLYLFFQIKYLDKRSFQTEN